MSTLDHSHTAPLCNPNGACCGICATFWPADFDWDVMGRRNGTPKEDFGGGHPDPNLTYAHELVELMWKVHQHSLPATTLAESPKFGNREEVASDFTKHSLVYYHA